MVSSGISDVAFASVHSEKTHLKKLIMIIIIIISIMKKIARISGFCRVAEMDFQHLAGTRNVSVDLKYDVFSVCVWYIRLGREK